MKGKRRNQMIVGIMLFYALASVIAGLIAGDSFAGFKTIILSPSRLTTDYFELGSVGGAFFNAGLVGLISAALFVLTRSELGNISLMAYFLTMGFSLFGINPLNMIFPVMGTFIYAKLSRLPFGQNVNMALFSTALAPFVSEIIFRYPLFDGMSGEMLWRILAAAAVGVLTGILMPILATHGHDLHKGCSLYNAASVAGLFAILIYGLLYKSAGIQPPTDSILGPAHPLAGNLFAVLVSCGMIALGFLLNGASFEGYKEVLKCTSFGTDLTKKAGVPLTMINLGVFGLFVTAYYNITGAPMTGVTVGCIICLMALPACGVHIFNMLPLMAGYALAALITPIQLSAQAIAVGVCFAGAMAPIPGQYGAVCGVAAGMVHAAMVTTVVTVHGGFCLYNGGFTSAITAMLLDPILEHVFTPNDSLALLPILKERI
ncbi:MAG: DUF1576 domain-containing protein [Clostridia bacterium]|nr:DUF1576 domain-containing protein [Clostridia bacterium]MBQ2325994.1 DUF1576 domain-containing protein [Clostridia bacterium]